MHRHASNCQQRERSTHVHLLLRHVEVNCHIQGVPINRVVSPTTSRLTPRNAGLLDGVKIGSPTRTRVTPGNTASVGDTIVG